MKITLLENAQEIRAQFIKKFVMSWEEFQDKHKNWIIKLKEQNFSIDFNWYKNAHLWDKMDPAFTPASFADALAYLRNYTENILFMSEQDEDTYYNGEEIVNFVAQADPHDLVNQIEHEWFNDYKLLEQNMYDPNAFLPQDLYVFDFSMKWCVAFTHETDSVYPESRYCIICTLED